MCNVRRWHGVAIAALALCTGQVHGFENGYRLEIETAAFGKASTMRSSPPGRLPHCLKAAFFSEGFTGIGTCGLR